MLSSPDVQRPSAFRDARRVYQKRKSGRREPVVLDTRIVRRFRSLTLGKRIENTSIFFFWLIVSILLLGIESETLKARWQLAGRVNGSLQVLVTVP